MEGFTDPFRYAPHPLVRKAAGEVIKRLDRMIAEGELPDDIARDFTDGKMLGVLICHSEEGQGTDVRTLYAFSGSVGGTSTVDGFVPPVFDLTLDGGHYRTHEAEITEINKTMDALLIHELAPLTASLQESAEARDSELEELRKLKQKASGIAESQFANGQIKRAKDRWKKAISEKESEVQEIKDRVSEMKKLRAQKSDKLQRWIFSQYIVHNASGETSSILEVFQDQDLMPPGGTGDCAAPKLLNHAFANGFKPVAMGEFWYGKSPDTAVRTHGHFYPSCTSKCGPLLRFMLKGTDISTDSCPGNERTDIIYEDEAVIVASKPSGMPSVPGLDGRLSLQERLQDMSGSKVIPVHRLDMDTSGIIVFAKNTEAEVELKRQFEEHSIRKTYMARLSPADTHRFAGGVAKLKTGDKGSIGIALSADYDERPRQKADRTQGKEAMTEYEVVSVNEDGTADILFHPITGRTHQLRVHSAHILGLGRPILGDRLYGGCGNAWNAPCADSPLMMPPREEMPERLYLHAYSIAFKHPTTGCPLNFSTLTNAYI